MSQEVRPILESEQHTLYLFSMDNLVKEAKETLGKELQEFTLQDSKTAGGYVVPVADAIVATKILRELGVTGEAVVKNVNGKAYVILKGLPGSRKVLTGTRYLANNPKIVKMAIGTKAVNRSIMKGSIVTLLITIPLSIADVCLKDQATTGHLIGVVATDIAKVLISSGVASLAALAVGAVTTVAAGPLIAAIFVGVAMGVALESLDQRYGITEKLVAAIDKELNSLYERTIGDFIRGVQRIEDLLDYQARNGLPVGQGVFY